METAVGAPRLARVEDGGWSQLARNLAREHAQLVNDLVSASLVQIR
jgi:hypothetical protein